MTDNDFGSEIMDKLVDLAKILASHPLGTSFLGFMIVTMLDEQHARFLNATDAGRLKATFLAAMIASAVVPPATQLLGSVGNLVK